MHVSIFSNYIFKFQYFIYNLKDKKTQK